MDRWFNPSHPQTLQAAVILGYISAVFGVLGSNQLPFFPLSILLFLALGVGAFGSANNKRWGYYLLAGAASIIAAFWVLVLALSLGLGIIPILQVLNSMVFPTALAVAALHAHSREYQRIWFD